LPLDTVAKYYVESGVFKEGAFDEEFMESVRAKMNLRELIVCECAVHPSRARQVFRSILLADLGENAVLVYYNDDADQAMVVAIGPEEKLIDFLLTQSQSLPTWPNLNGTVFQVLLFNRRINLSKARNIVAWMTGKQVRADVIIDCTSETTC
jgi:hypothetical protein